MPIIDPTTGKITGYKTAVGGADTVFPFSSFVQLYKRGTFFEPFEIIRYATSNADHIYFSCPGGGGYGAIFSDEKFNISNYHYLLVVAKKTTNNGAFYVGLANKKGNSLENLIVKKEYITYGDEVGYLCDILNISGSFFVGILCGGSGESTLARIYEITLV